MFSAIVICLSALLLWLAARILFPRANFYEYFVINGQRRPVLVGYVRGRDGTIIDITQPPGQRRVGMIYLKRRDADGRAVVRVYRPEEGGSENYDDVGWVDARGDIYRRLDVQPSVLEGEEADSFWEGERVGVVSPEGQRHWYELWLRRHADVPDADPEPYGKAVEAVRLKGPRANEPTLLARGGAALLLYRREVVAREDAPQPQPQSVWDTALLASAVFTAVYFVPGVVQFFDGRYVMFLWLGAEWSFVLSMLLLYALIWAALHALKVLMLSTSNGVLYYLTMINRQTGINYWTMSGVILGALGVGWSFFVDAYTYMPLFAAILTGFLAVWFFAPDEVWSVEPRARREHRRRRDEPDEGEEEEGDIVKYYDWNLDTPLRTVNLQTHVTFHPQEIDGIRQSNPFQRNASLASRNSREVSVRLVKEGERARQVQRVARFIVNRSGEERLTQLEEVQAALSFVQERNINYAFDRDCEEIGSPEDYYRLPAETLYDKRGDCDCKAVLAAALMRSLGYPVLVLISANAAHAAIAVGGIPDFGEAGDPFTIEHKGRRYYFCETTGDGWRVGQATDVSSQMRSEVEGFVDLSDDLPPEIK
ncbi:MAG TPA: transglutaminase domain-containing protein [Pyrinomonadaceae bacterium]|nr:transglutaminase domain-containing protein [Pyrinomonadaceae bacterium]